MKSSHLLIFGSLLAVPLLSLPAAPVESKISAVTVYTDRAVVTRTASIDVDTGGPIEAVFERLPEGLMGDSLRVAGSGTAKVTILDVTARDSFVNFTPNERVKVLEDELAELRKQGRILDDRTTVLRKESQALDAITTAATRPSGENPSRLPLESATQILAFLSEQATRISGEQRSIDQQNEDLSEKRNAVERQLDGLRSPSRRSTKEVIVRLASEGAGKVDLALSYAVRGAHWSPHYDARVASDGHAVRLGYFGVVRQNTGEDWEHIALTLSTARPALGGAPAALPEWIVDVVQPVVRAKFTGGDFSAYNTLSGTRLPSQVTFGTHAFVGDSGSLGIGGNLTLGVISGAGSAAAFGATAAAYSQATPDSALTTASFEVPTDASIVSDNSPQKVPIATIDLPCDPEYVAIPKRIQAAFLRAKVANASDFPLLEGNMSVFLDDAFIASSTLCTVMPGEKFELALGADDGISVKRTLKRRFTESTGIVNKGKRVTYEFSLVAQNNKKTAERIVLIDQIPVSRNAKVAISMMSPDTKDLEPDSDGTVKWTLTLAPGEKREVPLRFRIDYPNEIAVTGIDS